MDMGDKFRFCFYLESNLCCVFSFTFLIKITNDIAALKLYKSSTATNTLCEILIVSIKKQLKKQQKNWCTTGLYRCILNYSHFCDKQAYSNKPLEKNLWFIFRIPMLWALFSSSL